MTDDEREAKLIEELSAEIHKCYCRAYERRYGKPYWTNEDYSKLEEATKDYDREMARWHLEQIESLQAKLKEYEDDYKNIYKETCSVEYAKDDRTHCTCVPSLRKALKESDAEVERLRLAFKVVEDANDI